MFGYITPDKPELKVRELETYKAAYCGICKAIGRRCGLLPRMSVTYDSAFMALLHSAVTGECLSFQRQRCILHPLTKRCCTVSSRCIEYAADMNIMLAYHNARDKWHDDRSLPAAAFRMMLRNPYRKIRKGHPDKCGKIEKLIDRLNVLEKDKCASMDMAAEPFARILEEAMDMPHDSIGGRARESLRWLGYNTGKWIYILDAFDDLAKDAVKKSYNPLICQFGFKDGDIDVFSDSIRERVGFNLTHMLSEIAKSFEIMDIKCNSGIIENVIYSGMLRKTDAILNKGSCSKVGQSL